LFCSFSFLFFFFQAEDGIRVDLVTGVQTCALPICYRFADHIYRNVPSGRGRFGRWLDAKFLAMPAVKSFRNRFLAARDELCQFRSEERRVGKEWRYRWGRDE